MKKQSEILSALRAFIDTATQQRRLAEDYKAAFRQPARQATLLPALKETTTQTTEKNEDLKNAISTATTGEFIVNQAAKLHAAWNAVQGAKALYASEGRAENLFQLRDKEEKFDTLLRDTRQLIQNQ